MDIMQEEIEKTLKALRAGEQSFIPPIPSGELAVMQPIRKLLTEYIKSSDGLKIKVCWF